jgi:FAD/FMN-containing dehydrogenase
MTHEWRNWSGSLRFTPAAIETPQNEEELSEIIHDAATLNRKVRVAGAGHSSSPLVETRDVLVSLEHFKGLVSYDQDKHEATLRAGMTVHEAGQALLQVGLALPNTGDVDVQTLSGAISTGTHGTGRTLRNLSDGLIGVKMVNGRGEIVDYSSKKDPEFFCAARVSLGTFGIFTEITLKLQAAFTLERREYCASYDYCMEHLDHFIDNNRNFDFYWYPRRDETKLRIMNPPGEGDQKLDGARLVREDKGWSADILPRTRELKFDEMEYALPADAGRECFQEVRKRVLAKHRRIVGWRVLYRTVAADDVYLSPAYERPTITISLHQNAGLEFWSYFKDIEPIFQAYGGRPHWGKKHTLTALWKCYPMWQRFQEIRRDIDPDGRFLSAYLRKMMEE